MEKRTSDFLYRQSYKAKIDVNESYSIGDFMDWCEKYDLDQRLIFARGPGGDHPVMEVYTKKRMLLLHALAEFLGEQDMTIEEIEDEGFIEEPFYR